MSLDRQERLQDSYEALMLGYAAGILDQAQDLIVAAHLAMSPIARKLVQRCEAMGGFLLEHECSPVPMKPSSLDALMKKLDDPCCGNNPCAGKSARPFPEDIELPEMLVAVLREQRREPHWHALYPGLKAFDLELICKSSAARFVKIDPAAKSLPHAHGGMEITLILNGAFTDETGQYSRGDLIVTDENIEHAPVACPKSGCICMMVTAAPVKLKGLASLLNPFLRR